MKLALIELLGVALVALACWLGHDEIILGGCKSPVGNTCPWTICPDGACAEVCP